MYENPAPGGWVEIECSLGGAPGGRKRIWTEAVAVTRV